ncbi:hypothetical protein IR083_05185 [Dysgonomonas sp. GY75]|uniref:hypothetical protein n=1 Tax=Dysgonomonas sp. GY75 TaxID=2780419 RepID=UPI00188443C4|nr:hypothetical protein [Dysgonomonas sp. GY75]MBF0648201.1 hypothetical protein [Dysgonomonas sp. GY75]
MQPDEVSYDKRQKVNILIDMRDNNNKPLEGNFSISVTDDYYIPADTSRNILTTLLLTSELKGYVNNPWYYFRNEPQTPAALDLLMMTHGWRRYNIPGIIKNNYKMPILDFERYMQITGKAFDKFIFAKKKKYRISVSGVNNKYDKRIYTNKNGYFAADSIEFENGTGFRLRAFDEKAAWHDQSQQIRIEKENFPEVRVFVIQEKITENSAIDVIPQEYNLSITGNTYQLKPVVVTASYLGTMDYSRYNIEDIHKDIQVRTFEDLLEHLGINKWSLEHHGSSVIAYIDGRWIPLDEAMVFLKLHNIKGILFIKDMSSETANDLLYGIYHTKFTKRLNPAYGAIAGIFTVPFLDITTNDEFDSRQLYRNFNEDERFTEIYQRRVMYGQNRQYEKNRDVIYPLGYQVPVEYYAPKYETKQAQDNEIPDSRTTIHWQTGLRPDKNGQMPFSFYTADTSSEYTIVMEGVSNTGKIIYETKKIKVK